MKTPKKKTQKELYADAVGKTIKSIDHSSVNVLIFHFTDGTRLNLEVEAQGSGLYGNTPYEQEQFY